MITSFHVGIKGVIVQNGACLVLKKDTRDGRGHYDVPGGRINDSETLHETLTRELHEEVPSIGAFTLGEVLGAFRLNRDSNDDREPVVLIFYRVLAEPFTVSLSEEHSEFMWITKDTLPSLLKTGVMMKPDLYTILQKVLD